MCSGEPEQRRVSIERRVRITRGTKKFQASSLYVYADSVWRVAAKRQDKAHLAGLRNVYVLTLLLIICR